MIKSSAAKACAFALSAAGAASAHAPGAEDYAEHAGEWAIDPLGAVVLLLLAATYLRGAKRLAQRRRHRGEHARRTVYFWCAWAALAIAFGPPLEPLTSVSFAAHMVQHEMIMLIAAPLLVLARPAGVLLWGLPSGASRIFAWLARTRSMRRAIVWLCAPLAAGVLHFVVLWGWHMPAAFEASLASDAVHWLQHLTFFIAAYLFWYSVLAAGGREERRGMALISLLATTIHTGILGALLTFSPSVWYASYRVSAQLHHFTPLEDQQLGGLVMWVPGGAVFLVAAIAVLARWLAERDRPLTRET